METTEFLQIIFASLIHKLPVFIVLVGAIIYCIVNFSKHPKVNRLALSGMLILFAINAVNLFIPIFYTLFFKHYGSSGNLFTYVNLAVGFTMSLVYAAGLVLILYAVWTNRNQL